MRNIKLTIQYDGTHFKGWQVQKKGERTVQGDLQKALKAIFKESITLYGSGRTDTGVHAVGQVANFKTKSKLELFEVANALNANLSDDVRIINAEEANPNFHAQYSAKFKTYQYKILNSGVMNPIDRHFCLLYPYKLNVSAMKRASKHFIGTKNFKSFQGLNRSNRDQDTTRTISKITVKKQHNYIYITITADGFLYKMVRNIIGTLLEVGSGRLAESSIPAILAQNNRTTAPAAVKAHGLTLMSVYY